MKELKKINKIIKKIYNKNLNSPAIVLKEWGDKTSTTIFYDKKESVIELNPVVAVKINAYHNYEKQNNIPEEFEGVVAIHRFYLSIGSVWRMKTEVDVVKILEPLINAGKIDLYNQLGYLGDNFEISLTNSDRTEALVEVENCAVEGRLIVTKRVIDNK